MCFLYMVQHSSVPHIVIIIEHLIYRHSRFSRAKDAGKILINSYNNGIFMNIFCIITSIKRFLTVIG